jgi:hypothetical protein
MLGRLIRYAYLFFTSIKISREKRDEPCFMFMIHPLKRGGGGRLLPCPRKRENIRIILAVSALTRHFHFQGSHTLALGFFQSVAYAVPKDYQTFQAAASTIQAAAITFQVASSSFKQRRFYIMLRPLHFKLQPLFQTVASPFYVSYSLYILGCSHYISSCVLYVHFKQSHLPFKLRPLHFKKGIYILFCSCYISRCRHYISSSDIYYTHQATSSTHFKRRPQVSTSGTLSSCGIG